MKECSKCHQLKPETEYRYGKQRNGKLYIRNHCKVCGYDMQRRYRAAHPEKLTEYRARSVEARRDSVLKYRYGIGSSEYEEMLDKQEGRCAICGTSDPGFGTHLHIDHNHATGKIRALLCADCNTGLGKFKEDFNLLEKAAAYLRKHLIVENSDEDQTAAVA